MKKVIGFAGSLRKESLNKKVLDQVKSQSEGVFEFEIVVLSDIPLFNADDEEGGDPLAVQAFKEKIIEADGVFIVTPEYSHGIPGVLKNALDWAGSMTNRNALNGKPAAVIGASPSILGTAFAQVQVKQTLTACGAHVLNQPEVYIGSAHKLFDNEGKISDESTLDILDECLEAFQQWIERLKKE
ncbi:NADPH-dependent FMN reductase [Alteribacter populi]|uniref:NADPH-dependent FMN reductase n=1 Tax=Alteribacter populi TaxID=2011011 RepID=UPI000BBA4956|nr:NAD(P)H-dependent oxidoreductase [Alteribacter populi]